MSRRIDWLLKGRERETIGEMVEGKPLYGKKELYGIRLAHDKRSVISDQR